MDDILIYFEPSDAITVIAVGDLKFSNKHNDIYLVDEIDRICEHHAISFKEDSKGKMVICGLAPVTKGKKIYLLSATYGIFAVHWLKSCLGMKNFRKFRSQVEVTKNMDMEPFQAYEHVCDSDAELNALILKKFYAEGQSKPFILFDEGKDDALWTALKVFADNAKINCLDCEDAGDAKAFRESQADMAKGLIRLDNKFSRGIDVKLAKDAHVMIKLKSAGVYNMLDIYQFFGRGCRSQGHGIGTIYCLKTDKGKSVYSAIKANEGRKDVKGVAVDAAFFKHAAEMGPPEVILMQAMYHNHAEDLSLIYVEENMNDQHRVLNGEKNVEEKDPWE